MEKGERTRQLIYDKAKEIFAQKGYSNTTMREVTKALDLQPSWISYYFKQKSKIANEIIVELSRKISDKMVDSFGEIENPLLKRFVHMRLNYRVIVSDPANIRFIYEVSGIEDIDITTRQRLEDLVSDISKYYGVKYKPQDIQFFSDISLSAFNLTWQKYYEGKYHDLSEDRLSLDATKVFALLLGINSDVLNRLARRSKGMANAIDVSDLKLL